MLTKDKLFVIITFILFFFSCTNKNEIMNNYVKENFYSYSTIYSMLKDTINNQVDSMLANRVIEYTSEWDIDSLLCFNDKKNMFVTVRYYSNGSCYDCFGDGCSIMLGKIIHGKWYFFAENVTMIIPREPLGRGPFDPLSMEEISRIGREHMLYYMLKKEHGKWTCDDKEVEYHFTDSGWGTYETEEELNKIYLNKVRENWEDKIDTVTFKKYRGNKTVKGR